MRPARRGGLQLLLKQAQGMRQGRPAGEFGCRVDRAAAIGNYQRLASMSAKGSKVFERKRTAARLNIGRNAARQIAFVEIARTLRRQV